MRDRDHAAPLLVGGPHEQARDLLRGVLVETARGLVAEKRPRVAAKDPGDGHALLLAAREREHAAARVWPDVYRALAWSVGAWLESMVSGL